MSVNKKNLEDIVLVVLIAVGLIGCSLFFFTDGGKPLSAFFASFALSCIVYRFLGGIAQDTSFRMGFFKLGGSAAFMFASIWFLNTQVFVPQDTVLSMPKGTRWYPVRMDNGNPDTVRIRSNTGSVTSYHITENDYETLKTNEYTIERDKRNRFQIKKADIIIGFATTTLSNKLKRIHEPDIFTLHPYGDDSVFSVSKYPFKIAVETGYFHIYLRNKDNQPACEDCTNLEPVKKKHIFFEIDDRYYLCFVLQANHKIEQEHWYSQYLVGRLDFVD